jgi:cell wall-associated NlpC family hydrolase
MPRDDLCTMPAMRPTLQPLQPTHAIASDARRLPAARVHALIVAALVLAMAAFATLASAPANSPAATLASKQAQAAKLDAQVRKIETRYDELQERYRGEQYELDRIRGEVERAHVVVVATRHDLAHAKVNLASRADAIYRSGGTGADLADLASSGSFTDFFERIDTMNRVGSQDANVLVRVETLNREVEAKERVLKTAKARAAKATAAAKRAKDAMGKVRAERQAKLDSVNADIRAIMQAQRRAAAAKAAAAARESAALADMSVGGSSSRSSDSSSSSSGGSSIPLPPGSSTAAAAANYAMGKLGSPYVWAAAGPDSFDCSGLVVWAFAQAGRSGLPHSTYSLVNMGVPVPMDQLQVGDLLFAAGDGHVAIYVGNNSFVPAPHTGDVVKVTSLSDYYLDHARRI